MPIEIFGNANRGADFGDLDGDGDLDLFIANGGGQGSPVFRNNGFGTLTNTGQSLGNHSSSDVALGDLDGDGDLDAFLTNPFEQNRFWINGTSPAPPPPPTATQVTLTLDTDTISEAGGAALLTAQLSAATTVEVRVDLGFSGLAAAGDDYEISASRIVIPAGGTSGSVTVTAIQDSIFEPAESFTIEIVDVENGRELGEQSQTATIVDDDSPPSVTLEADTPDFPEAGGTSVVRARLATESALAVVIDLSFTGTARLFEDYLPPNPQIVIPAGELEGTAIVTAVQDEIDEDHETVLVDIDFVSNGTEAGTQQQTLRIVDDDPLPEVAFSVDRTAISEAGGMVTLAATTSAVSGRDVVVQLDLTGSASLVEPADYSVSSTQIVVEAGATTGVVKLSTIQDELAELDETVIVGVREITHGRQTGEQLQTITIIDDDRPPLVTLSVDTPAIPEAGGVATFTVDLSYAFKRDVLVELGVRGDATANQDYFAAGSQLVGWACSSRQRRSKMTTAPPIWWSRRLLPTHQVSWWDSIRGSTLIDSTSMTARMRRLVRRTDCPEMSRSECCWCKLIQTTKFDR